MTEISTGNPLFRVEYPLIAQQRVVGEEAGLQIGGAGLVRSHMNDEAWSRAARLRRNSARLRQSCARPPRFRRDGDVLAALQPPPRQSFAVVGEFDVNLVVPLSR